MPDCTPITRFSWLPRTMALRVGLALLAVAALPVPASAAEVLLADRRCSFGSGWTIQQGSQAEETLMLCDLDASFAGAVSVNKVNASTVGPEEDGSGAWVRAATFVNGNFGRAMGTASISFALSVQPFATAPFSPAVLPINLNVQAAANTDQYSTAGASVNVDGGTLVVTGWPANSTGGLDENYGLNLQPGQTVIIGKAASCGTRVPSSVAIVSAECSIALDPVPSFDQAAFDATWGAASFELARYYRFDAGLPTPVPEPATWALALCGAAMLAVLSRRRRSQSAARAVRSSP